MIEHGAKANYNALAAAVGHDRVEVVKILIGTNSQNNPHSGTDLLRAFRSACLKKNTPERNLAANLKIAKLLLEKSLGTGESENTKRKSVEATLSALGEERASILQRIKEQQSAASAIRWDKDRIGQIDAMMRLIRDWMANFS